MDEQFQNQISNDIKYSFYTPGSLRRKNLWLIKIRWVSILAALLFVIIVKLLLPEIIPLGYLLTIIIILTASNFFYSYYIGRNPPTKLRSEEMLVKIQIFADLILLTMIIHFTGGLENPFYFFYIFHVIITATIFENPRLPFFVALGVTLIFTTMVLSEYFGILEHYHINPGAYSPIQTILALAGFYVTVSVSSYIAVTLVKRHRKVKDLIFAQNEQLEQAAETKMNFFRFVSHELKSPIVAIQSSINVVLDVLGDEIPEKATDMIQRAKKRTDQMLNILMDLIDISYDRPVSNHDEMVNPCDFLEEFIENEKARADEKGITIVSRICREKKDFEVDRFKLEKVISNLLSNAIRYTPDNGRILINTDILHGFWIFKISDTGIGMSETDIKRVFDEFYRTANAKKFAAVGTGLGLTIVKRMVQQLNGEIELESKLNEGTTATVRIPIDG